MTNISWHHHYIPEFYLNGFTNDLNRFCIYLVKQDRFKKGGQLFSPQSHFFNPDANTLSTIDTQTDFLEESYSRIDDMAGKVFQKIKTSTEHKFGITGREIALLQWFVSILFWRLPTNEEIISKIQKNKTLKELGLILTSMENDQPVEDSEFDNKFKEDPNFFKFLRAWLPHATYKTIFECNSPLTILPFPSGLPAICSDNPLILKNPDNLDLYRDDFILPLTKDKIFIRTKKLKEQIDSIVKLEIDTLILMQAEEYVCCTDLRYPKILKDFFFKNFKTVDALRKSVFNKMIEE